MQRTHVQTAGGQFGPMVGRIPELQLDGQTLFGCECDHGMVLIVPGYRDYPCAAERILNQIGFSRDRSFHQDR